VTQEAESDFTIARQRMVREHLKARGIRDARVLAVMLRVPRELFVPRLIRDRAYEDRPLFIGYDQTISQPYITAFMTEALELEPTDRVLEIGTGSGYQTAILAELAATVYTIERLEPLSRRAQRLLHHLGYQNIHFRVGDGSLGWHEAAPFQAIIVTAGAARLPQPLVEQLATHGRLVIPIGPPGEQYLHRYRKTDHDLTDEVLTQVAFVPLVSGEGPS